MLLAYNKVNPKPHNIAELKLKEILKIHLGQIAYRLICRSVLDIQKRLQACAKADDGSGVVRGSRRTTALYHRFLDKITVIPLLSEGNYSFASVTQKVKRYMAHKVLPLPHCKF